MEFLIGFASGYAVGTGLVAYAAGRYFRHLFP